MDGSRPIARQASSSVRVLRRGHVGRRRRQVELVGVAGRDPVGPRRALAAGQDPDLPPVAFGERCRLGPEERVVDGVVLTPVGPAVRALPQAAQDLERLLEHVGPLPDRREREAVPLVLVRVPARPDPDLHPAAAHLVDGHGHLGQAPGRPERHRRDEDAEADPARVAGESGEHGPGVRRGLVGRARKALVVVGPEERLEPGRLGLAHDRQLVGIGEAHLGLGHQREPHVLCSPPPCVNNSV